MRRAKLLFTILLFTTLLIKAQNPFEELGVKCEMLTLSKGKFCEFFHNDTIVRIGSVIFNTVTNEVVDLVVIDSTNQNDLRIQPYITSRWMSPDPLAEKYWEWSPYNYCADNPIVYLDPNGEEIWIYYGTGEDDRYQYKNNQLYNTAGEMVDIDKIENAFVLSTFETLNGLISSGADELGIINTLANDDKLTNIFETSWDEKNRYDGSVHWSAEGGIVTDDGGRQSPALGLIHELGESYVDKYDPLEVKKPTTSNEEEWLNYAEWHENAGKYGNKTDEFIIKKIEAPAIDALNKKDPSNINTKRNNHNWTHKFKAEGCSFSTKGNELKKRKK
jgi:hypothetical protein